MKLTPKQEKFVQGIISGMSQREAYKAAYNAGNMKDNVIDVKAAEVMANGKVAVRYAELMDEHKEKALWTREKAVSDLIWIKDRAKDSVLEMGLRQANSNAFINAIKELNTLQDLYPKEKKEENKQESEIAAMLRKMAGEENGS